MKPFKFAKPKKFVQIDIALNLDGNKTKEYQFTGDTFEMCYQEILAQFEKVRKFAPKATIQTCIICSKRRKTYVEQIEEMKSLMVLKFPNVQVDIVDEIDGNEPYD